MEKTTKYIYLHLFFQKQISINKANMCFPTLTKGEDVEHSQSQLSNLHYSWTFLFKRSQ
jgi:hypothetical protein